MPSSMVSRLPLDVNKSGTVWEISHDDGKTLIQPLTSIKGLGMAAIEQILANRPIKTAEDLLFNENITYSKLNKKSLDALCRGGALDNLVDDRFTGRKHFWSACVVDRPKNLKKLAENMELYRPEGDFSEMDIIQFKSDLTGVFPMNLVISLRNDTKATGKLFRQSRNLIRNYKFVGLFRARLCREKQRKVKIIGL